MVSHPPLPKTRNPVQSQILDQNPATCHKLGSATGYENQPLPMTRRSNPNSRINKKFQNHPSSMPNYFGLLPIPSNWKRKKHRSQKRVYRIDEPLGMTFCVGGEGHNSQQLPDSSIHLGLDVSGGYKPPALNVLQSQQVPYAPRNTTSFPIPAKRTGPSPANLTLIPTLTFSLFEGDVGNMAKEEWGVDGYGSMEGLIRLKSQKRNGGSSESDVEEHVEVERRPDHDLSCFKMIYPNHGGCEYNYMLKNRLDDQDTRITQLEEENTTLKGRVFLMEMDLDDFGRRLQFLERHNVVYEGIKEEVVESKCQNYCEVGGSDACASNKERLDDSRGISTEDKPAVSEADGRKIGDDLVTRKKHEEEDTSESHRLTGKVSEK